MTSPTGAPAPASLPAPPAGPARTSYLDLVRTPGALAFMLPAAVGRLGQPMIGVGTVLMIALLRDSYGLAGAVAAAQALAQGVCAPLLGTLADRWGQTRVALTASAVHVPAIAALVLTASLEAPAWTMFVAAALTGGTVPLLSAFSRVRWSRLTGGTPAWDRALALESVIDEVVFIVGPVLATTLSVTVAPQAGLLAAGVLTGTGALLFSAARSTVPPARGPRSGGRHRPAILEPGLALVALVLVAMGAFFGTVDILVVALTRAEGVAWASGLLFAVFSLTSLVGGIAYGARRWPGSLAVRYAVLASAMGVATLLLPVSTSVLTLGASLAVIGVVVAPVLIAANALVAVLVRPAVLTEGFTWLTVAIFVGLAAGSPVAGAAVDAYGPDRSAWLGPAVGAVMVALAWAAARAAGRAVPPGSRRGTLGDTVGDPLSGPLADTLPATLPEVPPGGPDEARGPGEAPGPDAGAAGQAPGAASARPAAAATAEPRGTDASHARSAAEAPGVPPASARSA